MEGTLGDHQGAASPKARTGPWHDSTLGSANAADESPNYAQQPVKLHSRTAVSEEPRAVRSESRQVTKSRSLRGEIRELAYIWTKIAQCTGILVHSRTNHGAFLHQHRCPRGDYPGFGGAVECLTNRHTIAISCLS
jgi:hypothetical protein